MAAETAAAEHAATTKAQKVAAKRARAEQDAREREQVRQRAEERRQELLRLAEEARQKQSAIEEGDVGQRSPVGTKLSWRSAAATAAVFVIICMIYSAIRGSNLRSQLERCESKDIVNMRVSYAGFFATDTVIFDLRDGGASSARRIDAVHLLMQFADTLNLYEVRRVVLARDGRQRFYITGSELRPLADSYAGGGRIWAFNNLPSKVFRMDGSRAFEEWSGGWLGVLKEQVEDLGEFLVEWTDYASLETYSSSRSSPSFGADKIRSRVRETLRDMEDNVPDTLQAMEDNLPDVMADMEARMMQDAAKYGLSPSEVRSQLQEIDAAAREQIRGMEDDVRNQIRGMEDEVVESLRGDHQ